MKKICLCLVLMAGCAAQGVAKDPPEAIQSKTEAVVGAACTDDADCATWEHCARIVCITTPCPSGGTCQDQTRFDDAVGADIPDADPAGVSRTLTVSRPDATVGALTVSVSIDHTYRGDLRVFLLSPSGTEVVLHDRDGGSADGLMISREVPEVIGEPAAGDWRLVVQDVARYDVGRIAAWTLLFDFADSHPPPDDGRNVWATVTLPGVESAHPYDNNTDRTWDLRPWTGGSRARVHFETIDLERGYDYLEVINADTGRVLDHFTGRYEDLTTRDYDTAALMLRLHTDRSVVRYGFRADAVQVFGAGCLADEECGPGRRCDDSIHCIRAPCFQQCVDATGGEGDPCSGPADCAEELFCGTDGRCQRDGFCNEVADCSQEGNMWVHILCVGYPICTEEGACGYRCGEPLECVEGDIRDDGCNVCSCSGGRWLCTERYCPPVADEGEACGGGTICAEGLVCDRGPAEGAVCGDDRAGICTRQEPRYCRAVYAPVCTCNGQTFANECERQGHGDWASFGRCELSVAIPDADATGIRRTIHVTAPTDVTRARVQVEIDHTWRGDLVVTLQAPDGSVHVLHNRAGGSADDLDLDETVELGSASALGAWTLSVSDRARYDVGVLRFFNVLAFR